MTSELRTSASPRQMWMLVLAGAVLALVASAALATHALHIGSGRGGWVYPFVQPFTWRVAIVAAGVSGLAALLALTIERWSPRAWTRLLVLMLAGLAVEGALRMIAPVPLERVFVSDGANGFYGVSQRYTPLELLSHFNRVRLQSPLHVQSNLPGKSLLLSALQLVSTRPLVLAWILIAISTAGAWLTFAFVRELAADRRVAAHAAVLYLFVPARLAFLPLMNAVTPVFALLFAWLFMRGLRRTSIAAAVGAGIALYALVLFEPLPLVLGLFLAIVSATCVARGELAFARLVGQAAIITVTFIAVSETIAASTGFELVGAFHTIARHATAFNESASRPYHVWVGANLLEFMLAMGVCPAVLLAGMILRPRPPDATHPWLLQPVVATALGLLAVLLATDLIGINRGEVSRLWIFLACFCQIPAAWCCAMTNRRAALAVVVSVTAVQAAVAIAMIGFAMP